MRSNADCYCDHLYLVFSGRLRQREQKQEEVGYKVAWKAKEL